ncbi:hypothetical protein [Parvularcula marina]|uniref:Lipoprotein n=1 Tax=Parvularcula marina TaxID=2292771 RepID=A0A371RJE5_9PROT|nr:hypothetical protein [Parvularcula marina]RFB05577.1 hypothetical protein DX908_10060 [Parvularcula marina]
MAARKAYALTALAALGLSACASSGTYDLRPAYLAAVPEATSTYLDCDGVSDVVCDCRRGGLEQEFPKPSLTDFDAGYKVLAAEIDNGATHDEAEVKAIHTVFAEVTKDIEDICSYHEKEAAN